MPSKNNQFDKELARCEAINKAILTAVCEGVVVRDRDGQIIQFNEKAEKILGASLSLHPGLLGGLGNRSAEGRKEPSEWSLLREDGSPLSEGECPARVVLDTGKPVLEAIVGLRRQAFREPEDRTIWLTVSAYPVGPAGTVPPPIVVTTFKEIPFGPDSMTDALTGAYTKSKFLEVLDVEMKRTTRYLTPLTLLLLDIDGLEKGDYVLVTVADIVKRLIRKTDLIVRWKEEEFMVFLSNTTDEDGFYLAERIRRTIEEFPFERVGPITCSLGICEYMPNESEASLLKRLDDALYRAKAEGHNRVVSG